MLIGLLGCRKVGKTASANIICDLFPTFRKVAFADSLRELFREEYGISLSDLLDNQQKEVYRVKLIQFAEEKKKKDPYIFINAFFNSFKSEENIVCDDVRSIEEIASIFKYGGILMRVECDPAKRALRGWKYDRWIDEHPSETDGNLSADTIHKLGGYTIYNNGTIDQLLDQVGYLVLSIMDR